MTIIQLHGPICRAIPTTLRKGPRLWLHRRTLTACQTFSMTAKRNGLFGRFESLQVTYLRNLRKDIALKAHDLQCRNAFRSKSFWAPAWMPGCYISLRNLEELTSYKGCGTNLNIVCDVILGTTHKTGEEIDNSRF